MRASEVIGFATREGSYCERLRDSTWFIISPPVRVKVVTDNVFSIGDHFGVQAVDTYTGDVSLIEGDVRCPGVFFELAE